MEKDYQQEIMALKNDFKHQIYEVLNNTEVFVQIECPHNISKPFSSQKDVLSPYICLIKGPLSGLNNKLSDILLTVKERPKMQEN